MLKRLYIDNFRCFVNFEYRPERKQLLLGANGSGKSSLIEALDAFRSLLLDRHDDLRMRFREARTAWLKLPAQVLEIEAELSGKLYSYRIELKGEALDLWVSTESLKVEGQTVAEIVNGNLILYPANPDAAPIRLEQTSISHLSLFRTFANYREETKNFLRWVTESVFLQKIVPGAMHQSSFVPGRPRLNPSMSNISEWYRAVAVTDVESVIRLHSSLKEVLDGFESLNFHENSPKNAQLVVDFGGPNGTMRLGFDQLSDGQRCLIALYMILHFLIAKGHTVFIDEPDNFVSLREIQPWLLEAEHLVQESNGQLILISHHPELLNYWAKDFGLLFFREENGHVRTKRFRDVSDSGLEPAETIARGWEDE